MKYIFLYFNVHTFFFFRKVLLFELATFSMSSVIGLQQLSIAAWDEGQEENGDGIGVGLGMRCCWCRC